MNEGSSTERIAAIRTRREPPAFRHLVVRRVRRLTPYLVRVTFGGPDLEGFAVDSPAASVRLLLPSPGTDDLVVPAWNGNEFLLESGQRPTIRTFTPRRVDPDALELDLDVVLHGQGASSAWADTVRPGATAAMSGPGRGYAIDADAPTFLLAGDETAVPAISQLLEVLPRDTPVGVHVEVAHPDARIALPDHPSATVEWWDLPPGTPVGNTLFAAIQAAKLVPGVRVWVAGEAAAVQRIRRHLFDERGLPRAQATVRGYWKQGRSGDPDAAEE